MKPRFEYGSEVRLIRNVRNDGTYPGLDPGTMLVQRGAVGYVRDVGTFLQDQLIYSVDFFDLGMRVGCREAELIPADAEWTPSRFEFRDKVRARQPLALSGEVRVQAGQSGEIQTVMEGDDGTPLYEVRFPGLTLLVPELGLLPGDDAELEDGNDE
ncbi:nitrogen fixation protein NifZ [Acidihalobacter prosperus]|uniref:Protein NifZ n=1 Tax=Acidihalobacter prosperus TaxID=160660 RepID=A0A1A6C7S6_9GAMM|nr:nitrogen fixation protein NifZ [Acidihalobacter prosperus]OBS10600.1 protein NifZ [Acidihalobacter prosperus]